MSTVTAIVPSRLDRAPDGEYWAAKAVRSIRAQKGHHGGEVILAIDFGVEDPKIIGVDRVVRGPALVKSHVSAMNAAVKVAAGDVIGFLEDDDLWADRRLLYGLRLLENGHCDLVTCTQLEVDWSGEKRTINDFPTCSGWLMPKKFWLPADERFRIHWDNEWLGRQTKAGTRRIHLVEKDASPSRPWLLNVARFSRIMMTGEREPLVRRFVHADSVMGTCAGNQERQALSQREYQACINYFQTIPWAMAFAVILASVGAI